MKVKNVHTGPRGIRTEDGELVFLEKGEERELSVSEAEHKSAERTGYFAFNGKMPKGVEDQSTDEGNDAVDLTTADGLIAAESNPKVKKAEWRDAALTFLDDKDIPKNAARDDLVKAIKAKKAS